jgi:hypothetical protein
MNRAEKLKRDEGVAKKAEETTTMRVRVGLRNDLKKAAVMQEIALWELVDEVLGKYIETFQVSIGRNIKDLKKIRR